MNNDFIEALKEGARVAVLAIIPVLIDSLGRGESTHVFAHIIERSRNTFKLFQFIPLHVGFSLLGRWWCWARRYRVLAVWRWCLGRQWRLREVADEAQDSPGYGGSLQCFRLCAFLRGLRHRTHGAGASSDKRGFEYFAPVHSFIQ